MLSFLIPPKSRAGWAMPRGRLSASLGLAPRSTRRHFKDDGHPSRHLEDPDRGDRSQWSSSRFHGWMGKTAANHISHRSFHWTYSAEAAQEW